MYLEVMLWEIYIENKKMGLHSMFENDRGYREKIIQSQQQCNVMGEVALLKRVVRVGLTEVTAEQKTQ